MTTRAAPRTGTKSAGAKVATPWGQASVVEEAAVAQRVGDRRFSSLVQLLENAKGERFVRFAYSSDGVARRGPVTFRVRDLERLRSEVGSRPELAEALRFAESGGDA